MLLHLASVARTNSTLFNIVTKVDNDDDNDDDDDEETSTQPSTQEIEATSAATTPTTRKRKAANNNNNADNSTTTAAAVKKTVTFSANVVESKEASTTDVDQPQKRTRSELKLTQSFFKRASARSTPCKFISIPHTTFFYFNKSYSYFR
jgi:hypothetical protein